MARKEIVRAGLSDQAFDELERRLLNLEFEPGSRLVIDQLARTLGVSATPVRDALARLAGQRLVDFEPYVGFTVRPIPTLSEIDASFEARLVIEPAAARLGAAARGEQTAPQLAQIEDYIASQIYTGDAESFLRFVKANRHFHESVVGMCQNEFLIEGWRNLHHDEIVAFTLHDRGIPDLALIRQEHDEIVHAVQAADPDHVEAVVASHITKSRQRIIAAHAQSGRTAHMITRTPARHASEGARPA